MEAAQERPKYIERRSLVRVVNRRNYTVACKKCGTQWRPAFNENGRVVRWGLRCPNPDCEYHQV